MSGRARPLAETWRLGRAWFKTKGAVRRVVDRNGQEHRTPEAVDDALWRSREAVWRRGWAPSAASAAMLRRFGGSGGPVGALECTLESSIAAACLAAAGSALGVDGWPYEVLHCGAGFVAAL